MMEHIDISDGLIFYDNKYDGGGAIFGIDCLKFKEIYSLYSNKSNLSVCEMCSGPGFMGFYLKLNGFCDGLSLVDINGKNNFFIEKTIKYNNLKNVKFVESDSFRNVPRENYDFIILNPPHYSDIDSYELKLKEMISDIIKYDPDWKFHKHFLNNVHDYLNDNGSVVLIENHFGSDKNIFLDMIDKDIFHVDVIENLKLDWGGRSNFYIIILRKK
jgi:methylase of polypeptide subunit release factors